MRNRDKKVREGPEKALETIERNRLAGECSKPDPEFEKAIAEERMCEPVGCGERIEPHR